MLSSTTEQQQPDSNHGTSASRQSKRGHDCQSGGSQQTYRHPIITGECRGRADVTTDEPSPLRLPTCDCDDWDLVFPHIAKSHHHCTGTCDDGWECLRRQGPWGKSWTRWPPTGPWSGHGLWYPGSQATYTEPLEAKPRAHKAIWTPRTEGGGEGCQTTALNYDEIHDGDHPVDRRDCDGHG